MAGVAGMRSRDERSGHAELQKATDRFNVRNSAAGKSARRRTLLTGHETQPRFAIQCSAVVCDPTSGVVVLLEVQSSSWYRAALSSTTRGCAGTPESKGRGSRYPRSRSSLPLRNCLKKSSDSSPPICWLLAASLWLRWPLHNLCVLSVLDILPGSLDLL